MTEPAALVDVLRTIQARGAIGSSPVEDAIAHAGRFASRVPTTARRAADLGSGGGLPGLVVAVHCPWLDLVLVERRLTRADLLRRAVVALGLEERVRVHAADVRTLAPTAAHTFDVVTARSFAAPEVTVRWASDLLVSGGLLLVSEPPEISTERWPQGLLQQWQMADQGCDQGIRVLQRH